MVVRRGDRSRPGQTGCHDYADLLGLEEKAVMAELRLDDVDRAAAREESTQLVLQCEWIETIGGNSRHGHFSLHPAQRSLDTTSTSPDVMVVQPFGSHCFGSACPGIASASIPLK